jgi:glycosyltransferase involved in cell wall biosynthesis
VENSIGLSVVVCCYNSIKRIKPTLESLSNQKVTAGLSWEVILVNNNSSDGTVEYATEVWKQLGEPVVLKIVDETNPGIGAARLKGMKSSRFDFVLFCDDDNWLCENYVSKTFFVLNSDQEIGAVGGYGIATSEVDFPEWFDQYAPGYAVGKPNFESGILPQNHYLITAGMGLRKQPLLDSIEIQPLILNGRKGKQLGAGEDTEICYRFLLANKKLYYNSELYFQHFLPKERLTIEYRDKLFEGFKQASEVFNFYDKLIWVKQSSFSKKLSAVCIIFLKLPITFFGLIKRWDLKRDLLYFYLISGIALMEIPEDWQKIRERLL